jgi:hypothetical protein
MNPHDRIELREGAPGRLAGDLLHYSYRDLRHQIETVNSFTSIAAEELVRRGRGAVLARMLFHPPAAFFRAYVLKRGFLEGVPGFILAVVAAFYSFLKYAKLWEARNGKARPPE